MERPTKRFPVFDCDAHVNDNLDIWKRYVPESQKELVRASYWVDEKQAILNGRTLVFGGQDYDFHPMYNSICIAGPGMNKKLMRKLQHMPLTDEQRRYLVHQGAYDPKARLREMDLMGIDQVMIIPTMLVQNFPFIENAEGARVLARAYNDWAADYCAAAPDRLYAAAWLPLQSVDYTVEELERVAARGFRMALVRPWDAQGRYPNQLMGMHGGMDKVFKKFEELGVVLGMHTFPGNPPVPTEKAASPGQYLWNAGGPGVGPLVDGQTMSFIFEAQAWLAQTLLAGFLDRYPKLQMAILESNATWLPSLLEHLDRLFKAYKGERLYPAKRLPSEAFYAQCFIAFEADEEPTFRRWRRYEDIGIWSSDAYHHDGADAWDAIRRMTKLGVPEAVQAKLLGGNARRMYRIEPKLYVTEEPAAIPRPDWFPKPEEVEEFAAKVANPRKSHFTEAPRLRMPTTAA